MAGRKNKPDNDGPSGKPGRLDQFGDQLGAHNEEEFAAAASQACELRGGSNDDEQ